MNTILYTIWYLNYQWHIVLTPKELSPEFQVQSELEDIARIILAHYLRDGGHKVQVEDIPYPVGMWDGEHGNVYKTAQWQDCRDLEDAEKEIRSLKWLLKACVGWIVILLIALIMVAT
tara:strand:- start:14 stop:367 length:354 start_codon:yes stop_codon:yes gene_type:complete